MMNRTPEQKKLAKEEEVTLTVSHDELGQVVLHFPLQNMKFGVPPGVAVQVALALIRHAESIEQEAS